MKEPIHPSVARKLSAHGTVLGLGSFHTPWTHTWYLELSQAPLFSKPQKTQSTEPLEVSRLGCSHPHPCYLPPGPRKNKCVTLPLCPTHHKDSSVINGPLERFLGQEFPPLIALKTEEPNRVHLCNSTYLCKQGSSGSWGDKVTSQVTQIVEVLRAENFPSDVNSAELTARQLPRTTRKSS